MFECANEKEGENLALDTQSLERAKPTKERIETDIINRAEAKTSQAICAVSGTKKGL